MAVKVCFNKKDPADLLARDVPFQHAIVLKQTVFDTVKVKSNFWKYSRAEAICQSG